MGIVLGRIGVCMLNLHIVDNYPNLRRCMIWAFETKGLVHNLLDKELLMFGLFVYFSMLGNCYFKVMFLGKQFSFK